MSKPPRIDRKTLKNPDQFVKRGQVVIEILARQRSRIVFLLGGGALILVAVLAYDGWVSRSLDQAWVKYFEVTKKPEAERVEAYKQLFEQSRSKRPSLFAAVNVADHYFDLAKKELMKDPAVLPPSAVAASEWYSKAMEFKALLPSEKQLLLINQGGVFEMQKKWDEALGAYRSASDLAGDAKGYALLNVGRAFELKNDIPKATETYEKVSTDFSNTEYSKAAKNNLRRLKSPLFQTASGT